MQDTVREYDAKLDTKKRVTLRSVLFDYYHVTEYADGRIVMEPRCCYLAVGYAGDTAFITK